MATLIIYTLTLLGFIAYIFIAGMFIVWMRMQYFAQVNERHFSYSIMEESMGSSTIDHIMAIVWPVILIIIFSFYIAEKIYKIRTKDERAHL